MWLMAVLMKLPDLASLGVDPEFGGQGIASDLLQHVLGVAEEAGLPLYLEATPAGTPVYRKNGFTELGTVNVLGEHIDHHLTVFIKRPKGKAS